MEGTRQKLGCRAIRPGHGNGRNSKINREKMASNYPTGSPKTIQILGTDYYDFNFSKKRSQNVIRFESQSQFADFNRNIPFPTYTEEELNVSYFIS